MKNLIRRDSMLLWVTLAMGAGCGTSAPPEAGPHTTPPSSHPFSREAGFQPGEDDRCGVCAMSVSTNPKTTAALQAADGRTWYFCGNGCLIRCYLASESCVGVPRDALRVRVQDYFDGRVLDGLEASWVQGSDVTGPMGPMAVPLADDQELETFRQRHGGAAVFRLGDLDTASWDRLRDLPPAGP